MNIIYQELKGKERKVKGGKIRNNTVQNPYFRLA